VAGSIVLTATTLAKKRAVVDGPKMKELSKHPKLKNGDVKVHAVGLCKFWEEN